MNLLYIFLLAAAISLDGFFVGVTYGFRRIKVGFWPLCIISCTSALVIMLSMFAGDFLSHIISQHAGEIVGAIILVGVGLFVIYETSKSFRVDRELKEGYSIIYAKEEKESELHQLFTWKIKPLGLIINILREPTEADLDASGSINMFEAVFLGLALALDALGAGFGAALTGFNPLLIPIIVGVTKFIFLYTGNYFASRVSNLVSSPLAYLSGAILILLGLFKLI